MLAGTGRTCGLSDVALGFGPSMIAPSANSPSSLLFAPPRLPPAPVATITSREKPVNRFVPHRGTRFEQWQRLGSAATRPTDRHEWGHSVVVRSELGGKDDAVFGCADPT